MQNTCLSARCECRGIPKFKFWIFFGTAFGGDVTCINYPSPDCTSSPFCSDWTPKHISFFFFSSFFLCFSATKLQKKYLLFFSFLSSPYLSRSTSFLLLFSLSREGLTSGRGAGKEVSNSSTPYCCGVFLLTCTLIHIIHHQDHPMFKNHYGSCISPKQYPVGHLSPI